MPGVGGEFTGVAITLQLLCGPQAQRPANFILISGFLALFTFVTVSGLLFVHNPRRTRPLVVATAIQVPWFSSPFVAYKFAAGFQVTVVFIGGRFNGGFQLGSDFQFNLLQQLPWGVGFNVFALVILVLLLRCSEPPNLPPPGEDGSSVPADFATG
jgi:cytochrome b561